MGAVSPLYATLTPTPYVIPIANGSGLLDDWVTPALTNPMTTDQDLIVGGVGGAPGRLGVGPVGYVLTVGSGGLVDWAASTGGFVNPMTTSQDLIVGGISGAPGRLAVGSVGKVLTVGSGGIIDWETPAAAGGTVTTVSVVSANGFAGTVATATTTPAITLTTTITGVLKGNGTAISAASAGTDYVAPGAITTSGLTMATTKMLGRASASTGAIEEIAVTGSGSAVLANTPTLITPVIGAATGTSLVLSGGLTSGAVAGVTGFVALKGLTSGTFTMSVNDAAGTWTAKWPATAGSNTNVLATDGSGNFFWQATGTGSGTVNSGTATQLAYYPASAAAVSSTPAFTISAGGAPSITASGTNNDITLTPIGTGAVVVPGSATTSTFRAGVLEVQSFTTNNVAVGDNAYYDGSNIKYRTTGFISMLQFNGGEVWLRTAPSGTGGTTATLTTLAKLGNTGIVTLSGNITSSSTTTGTLVVTGGAGVSGAFFGGSTGNFVGTLTLGSATITNSSGAISIVAAGSNQNVNLNPSGTGYVVVPSVTNQTTARIGGLALQTYAVNNTSMADNVTYDGSNNKYIVTGFVSMLQFNGGEVWLRTAPSGSAGATATTTTWFTLANTGEIALANTTDSTTTATGSLHTLGGLGVAKAVVTGSSIKTGTPSGGTAGAWKFGILVTAAVTADTTRYIQLDVGGTLYKLIIST